MSNDLPDSYLPLPPRHFEILLALEEGPRHGYAIIRTVHASSGGAVVLATSTLYSSLRRLLSGGLVEEMDAPHDRSDGPPRKYYSMTALGRHVLHLEATRVARLAARVRSLGLANEGGA